MELIFSAVWKLLLCRQKDENMHVLASVQPPRSSRADPGVMNLLVEDHLCSVSADVPSHTEAGFSEDPLVFPLLAHV